MLNVRTHSQYSCRDNILLSTYIVKLVNRNQNTLTRGHKSFETPIDVRITHEEYTGYLCELLCGCRSRDFALLLSNSL